MAKKLHYKRLQVNHPSTKRNKRHTRSFHLNYDQKRANSVDRMMALCSHCRLGLGVKPSAMSPTLQLSTFIKRLQTPPLTHWQDWGWPADGALPFCPMILCENNVCFFLVYQFFLIYSFYTSLCRNKSVVLCKTKVQRLWYNSNTNDSVSGYFCCSFEETSGLDFHILLIYITLYL